MSVLPIDIKSFMSSLAATKESVECRLVMSIDVHYIAARSVTVGERELIGPPLDGFPASPLFLQSRIQIFLINSPAGMSSMVNTKPWGAATGCN